MKILFVGETSAIAQGLISYFADYDLCLQSSRDYPILNKDADIVINFAGISLLSDLAVPNILNKKLVEVNCLGAVNLLQVFLPAMRWRKYGRIILMSSVCSVINITEHGIYSASKAFIDKLIKIAALENAQYGITVNSIQLGYTGIGMSESTPENMERQKNKSALKRYCTMGELYNAIKFIIDTEYFTGQNLRLDGGIK